MANQEHLDILKQGVDVWNQWREEHSEMQPDLSGADLSNTDLQNANLSRADLSGANLHEVSFISTNLKEANLSNSDLRGAILIYANLMSADIHEADLSGADFREAMLCFTNLSGAKLVWADLSSADLSNADLRRADLGGADFHGLGYLEGVSTEAILSGVKLDRADLEKTDLHGLNLSGANFLEANLFSANLQDADLSNTILFGANLGEANLSNADLGGADLSEANLRWTKLNGACLIKANLSETYLIRADLSDADLSDADLSGANLSEANLNEATLDGCRVYAISAWNVNFGKTIQSNLIITRPDEPFITVDNLEVAQFIYLLLNNEKIRDVIDSITSKVVLILGRFTPERRIILDALRDELRNWNYTPVLFDFEKPASRDFTETVRTLAHLSRFIIADLTDPSSIPQELQSIVPDLEVPVQPLLLEAKREYSMFVDFRKYNWALPTYLYKDRESLIASLQDEIIEPAEKKARELAIEKSKRLERP